MIKMERILTWKSRALKRRALRGKSNSIADQIELQACMEAWSSFK